jgi:UDP-MurNAc hydroxylase
MDITSIGHAGFLIRTEHGTVLCDPWFIPAFFGSWFPFPRNDHLPADVMAGVEQPDVLYVSHLHGDHYDEAFLSEHVSRDATVVLPAFPTDELERHLRRLGFTHFVQTEPGVPVTIGGLTLTIHVETSLTDGPGGDSALVVDDGEVRLLDQNDCRLNDFDAVLADGPIDVHCLQYSGAIWYPMVYDLPDDELRRLAAAKVEAQFARAERCVTAVGARVVIPSAGPPCFLDPELAHLNVVTGGEISIFPDAPEFVARLAGHGIDTGVLLPSGSTAHVSGPDGGADGPSPTTVTHPHGQAAAMRPYTHKGAYLAEYAADWERWLAEQEAAWHAPRPDLLEQLQARWEPLLASAPALRAAIGGGVLLRLQGAVVPEVLLDAPAGTLRPWTGEPFDFSFDIDARLVQTVLDREAVDWSNALFLSCRFRAWRAGGFNEHLYNFFKSLSPERMVRAEAQAVADALPPTDTEVVEIDGWIV